MIREKLIGQIEHKFFNFQAVGVAGVVLSVWLLRDQTFLISLVEEQHKFNAGLYILQSAGILMLIVAILGCCGAFRESQCMLVAFFSCLLVVIVAQIAAAAWLYSNCYSLGEMVESSVIYSVKVSAITRFHCGLNVHLVSVKGISNYP